MTGLLVVLALAAVGVVAPASVAGGVCSPGQHGNKHPGFKPGSC
jgi:hypothetical protein